jgi:hypothetical protein
MGIVYRAHDIETGTDIAVKTLHRWNPTDLYFLKQEFRAIADIRHANLVELYELHANETECFLTMELVEGTEFVAHFRRAPFDETRFADALNQLIRGLDAVHAAGQLHRDVKPSNVLITSTGRVVVLDFGLATALRGGDDGGVFVGTPAYMAPEQARGASPAPAADWYAVGVMLWEVITGTRPFEGPPARIMMAKQGPQPILDHTMAPDLPEWVAAVVRGLMDPDPGRRPDAPALLAALERRMRSRSSSAESPFVNRTAETAALLDAFEGAADGPVVALVHGASGLGKTRLVRHFVQQVESTSGAMVLSGRCHPQETVTYKGFDEIIDQLSRRLVDWTPEEIRVLVPERAAGLRLAFPVLARLALTMEPGEIDSGVEPYELRRRGFAALRHLLAALATQRPLVMWIDDAQWAGEDSAALLREVVRSPDAPKALVVLSFHHDVVDAATIRAARESGARVVDIPLHPLDATATRALLRAVVTTSAVDIDAIAAEAQGSPFLITQLAGFQGTRTGVRLQDVLDARVGQLTPEARAVLEIACIAHRPLDRAVALEAAGVGQQGRPLIAALRRGQFVRLGGPDLSAVETYHDRVRDAVLGRLSAGDVADRHRSLARALEARGDSEPDRLSEHFFAAGDAERASSWAAVAGDRAATSLAFAQAAVFYRRAREWWHRDDDRSRDLQVKEADALVNAGRCAEAARLYLSASQSTVSHTAQALRQRAAEEFLAGGHLDDGLAVLVPLLKELHISYPSSQRRAISFALARLVQLALRGTRFAQRAVADIAPRALRRVDVCYSAAKSLSIVDPARGIYFSVRGLLLALGTGEPVRVGKHLAVTGGSLRALGGPFGSWGQELVRQVARLAESGHDAYLSGMSATSMAPVHIVAGEWREALECAEHGVALLAGHCRGVSFECAVGRMAALRALEELGRMSEMRARAEDMLAGADQTGDRYAEVTALLNLALPMLATADVAAARGLVARALAQWTREAFHIQHFYARRIEAYCDLYEGRPDRARAGILAIWPALRTSSLLRVPVSRVDAHLLRARSTVALAAQDGRYAPRAESDMAPLARESRGDAVAHVFILRAGLQALPAHRPQAIELVGRAIAAYRRAGMELHALCAERRGAEIAGAVERLAAIDQRIRDCGINEPVRWVDIYAPGFRTASAAA